jgi:hypothetical protein
MRIRDISAPARSPRPIAVELRVQTRFQARGLPESSGIPADPEQEAAVK